MFFMKLIILPEELLNSSCEGTALTLTAAVGGINLTSTKTLQVSNTMSIATGNLFHIDAEKSNGTSFAGATCPGVTTNYWVDLENHGWEGSLTSFPGTPCIVNGSGWNGTGTAIDPYRVTFDGVDDKIDFAAHQFSQIYTIVAWIRNIGAGVNSNNSAGGSTAWPVVSKGSLGDELEALDVEFFLGVTPGRNIEGDFENSTDSGSNILTSVGTINDNQWHQVALVYSHLEGNRYIYIDGALDNSEAISNIPADAENARLMLGGQLDQRANNPTGAFNGDIAIVQIYDRALHINEIKSLCTNYMARFNGAVCN
jgi:hypothetical protein